MLEKLKIKFLNIFWRKKNKYNNTKMNSVFPFENVIIGKETYGNLNVKIYNKNAILKIGNYCSIADRVQFLLGGEHNYKRISTFPFQSLIYRQKSKKELNRNIIIDDDVWIGYDTLILAGTHIGQGCVIGAKSIVTGDIPPYSIYVGNKVIKKRFPDEIVEKLLKIDYSKINHYVNDSYSKYCQDEITFDNIDLIIDNFIKTKGDDL